MIGTNQLEDLMHAGGTVVGSDGDRIGKVGQVYLDDATNEPEWVTVKTGLFGASESFIPLAQAEVSGNDIHVPYAKAKVKDAPRVESDQHISPEEEVALYRYYGLQYSQTDAGVNATTGTGTTGTTSAAAAGSAAAPAGTPDARSTARRTTSGSGGDDAMTRSEEELRVGIQVREAGRAKLRKHVVTERQSVTVPVSHEEVTLEHEPITEANRAKAYDGPEITENEHVVTLHEQVPVVSKETHPVERVKVGVRKVTEQQTVTEDVRKEQIELDTDTAAGRVNPQR